MSDQFPAAPHLADAAADIVRSLGVQEIDEAMQKLSQAVAIDGGRGQHLILAGLCRVAALMDDRGRVRDTLDTPMVMGVTVLHEGRLESVEPEQALTDFPELAPVVAAIRYVVAAGNDDEQTALAVARSVAVERPEDIRTFIRAILNTLAQRFALMGPSGTAHLN